MSSPLLANESNLNSRSTQLVGYNVYFQRVQTPMLLFLLIAAFVGSINCWCYSTKIVTNSGINSLDFSPDGTYILTGDTSGWVVVWKFSTLQALKIYNFNNVVEEAIFSKDQSQIAVGGHDDIVTILNFPAFTHNKTLITGHGGIWDLDFNYASNRLLTCGNDSRLRTWMNKGNWSVDFNQSMGQEVYTCEFSRDQDILAAGNQKVETWTTGLSNFEDYDPATYGSFKGLRSRYSQHYFIAANENGKAYEFKTKEGDKTEITTTASNLTGVAYTLDDQYFVLTGSSSKVFLFNATNRVNTLLKQIQTNSTSNLVSAKFTYDSKYLAVGNQEGTIYLFTRTCIACDPLCAYCFLNATYCSACVETGINEAFLFSANSSCLSQCPVGWYAASATHTCLQCSTLCLTCSLNATYCSSCQKSGLFQSFLFFQNSSCLYSCPNGYYAQTLDHTCTDCDKLCTICSINDTFCSECNADPSNQAFLYSQNSTCLTACPDGFYEEASNHTCQPCEPECAICDQNSTFCSLCASSGLYQSFLFVGNSSCLDVCPDGYYAETLNHTCTECDVLCSICAFNSTYCSVCSDSNVTNAFLYSPNSSCLSTCPEGYYQWPANHTCLPCLSPCDGCSGVATNCTSCLSPTFLAADNSSCLSNCPHGFFQLDNACVECSADCQDCSQSADNCSSCDNSTFFLENSCVSQCPQKYTQDLILRQCISIEGNNETKPQPQPQPKKQKQQQSQEEIYPLSNITTLIGVVIGTVGVVGLIVGVLLYKRHVSLKNKVLNEPAPSEPHEPNQTPEKTKELNMTLQTFKTEEKINQEYQRPSFNQQEIEESLQEASISAEESKRDLNEPDRAQISKIIKGIEKIVIEDDIEP